MTDGHIHIEAGPYTMEWIDQFVTQALKAGLTEIRLLEHCYRFREFATMYDSVEAYSPYASDWVHRRVGVFPLSAYLELIDRARQREYPITVKFGLEICYFREQETLIAGLDEKITAASADYQELSRLMEEKQTEETKLSGMMDEWESLSLQLEESV